MILLYVLVGWYDSIRFVFRKYYPRVDHEKDFHFSIKVRWETLEENWTKIAFIVDPFAQNGFQYWLQIMAMDFWYLIVVYLFSLSKLNDKSMENNVIL